MPPYFVSHSVSKQFDLLKLHQLNPKRYPFLLESLVDSNSARYNILFAFPQETITSDKHGFLENFAKVHNQNHHSLDLPFCGGWFLFLDYELNQEIEPILNTNHKSKSFATRIPAAIIQDKLTGLSHFVCENQYKQCLSLMDSDYQQAQLIDFEPITDTRINFTEEDPNIFLASCNRTKEYIIAGDVFQVNLSRLWHGVTEQNASILYDKLRNQNPASFSGLVVHNNIEIISSSPERLVKVKDSIIETRPIAGTRHRSENNSSDLKLADELLSHPKEQAEHIMLLDLERNDLGRICYYGSVEVSELMVLESYAHVHHIVSNVKGKLLENTKPVDIIKAVFPGGTITGCPKVRCMQIINELEKVPRGAYTGSLGYLNHNGDMDLNILIRTIEKNGNNIKFRAGSGIVYDSIAQEELNETRHKAKGLKL